MPRAAVFFVPGCFGKRDDDLPPAYDPTIGLCDKLKGSKVIIEGGTIVSGTGSVLGDSPVLQDKAYFELTIRTEGTFAVGVATKDTPLDGVVSHEKVPTAWNLRSPNSRIVSAMALPWSQTPVSQLSFRNLWVR